YGRPRMTRGRRGSLCLRRMKLSFTAPRRCDRRTETPMTWKLCTAGMLAAMLLATAPPSFADDVVIKLWSRADRSGPLRAGNLVAAGDTLNKMLAATGSDKRVKIELNETNAKGYDDDAHDLCDLAGQAVQKGVVKYGILHRPNAGPDFQMLTETFGLEAYDKTSARLQASKTALKEFFTWMKHCLDKKALSPTNTAMSWDAIEQAAMGGEEALA